MNISPGPWEFQRWGSQVLDARKGSSKSLVATIAINTFHDEGMHNARLITAAPDLLAALNSMLEYTAEMNANQGMGDDHPAVIKAGAAITKATGGRA